MRGISSPAPREVCRLSSVPASRTPRGDSSCQERYGSPALIYSFIPLLPLYPPPLWIKPHTELFLFSTVLGIFPAVNAPQMLLPINQGDLSLSKAPPRRWAGGAGGGELLSILSVPSQLLWIPALQENQKTTRTWCLMIYSIPSCGFNQAGWSSPVLQV